MDPDDHDMCRAIISDIEIAAEMLEPLIENDPTDEGLAQAHAHLAEASDILDAVSRGDYYGT